MTDFRPGVLIHNFNEDRFGVELVSKGKMTFPTPTSITQSAYRDPREYKSPPASGLQSGYATTTAPNSGSEEEPGEVFNLPPGPRMGMDANLLFGHSGDMRNTKGLKQKAYITTAQYFYQKPEKSFDAKNGKTLLTVEKFYDGAHPIQVSKDLSSTIADVRKKGWADDKATIRTPYTSVYKKELAKDMNRDQLVTGPTIKYTPTVGLEMQRIPRVKGEFTRKVDAVCIKRSRMSGRGATKGPSKLEQRLQRNAKNVKRQTSNLGGLLSSSGGAVAHDGGKLPPAWVEKIRQAFVPVDEDVMVVVNDVVRQIEETNKTPASRKTTVLRVDLLSGRELRDKVVARVVPISKLLEDPSAEGRRKSGSPGAAGGESPTLKPVKMEDTVPCPSCESGRAVRTFGKIPGGKMAKEYIRYECLDCGKVTQVNE
eukprot:g8767.t1